jgi:hypothetical protein
MHRQKQYAGSIGHVICLYACMYMYMCMHVHVHTSMCYILAIFSSISQRAAAQVITDVGWVHQTGPSIFTQRSFTTFYNSLTDMLSTIISKPIVGTAVHVCECECACACACACACVCVCVCEYDDVM